MQDPTPPARSTPSASIVIPTRQRPDYLEVALASIAPQAAAANADVVVVADGGDPGTRAVAERHAIRLLELPAGRGANAARNLGISETAGETIVFVDDDVDTPAGWLQTVLHGVAANPDCDVFGGPIHARLEGGGPRACGLEQAPITTLEQGQEDRDVPFVWSANMAVRRAAFERLGRFDESIRGRGEEEEWQRRYAAAGGRIRYLGRAGVDHRRTPADATVWALSKAAYRLGRSARRNDARKQVAPPITGELRTLAGCVWHIFRRRCEIGVVMLAETAGRVREAAVEQR